MIKIIYEQDKYDYNTTVVNQDMKQEYKEKYSIEIANDADLYQAFDAFIKVLKVAEYSISAKKVLEIAQEYYEYNNID